MHVAGEVGGLVQLGSGPRQVRALAVGKKALRLPKRAAHDASHVQQREADVAPVLDDEHEVAPNGVVDGLQG